MHTTPLGNGLLPLSYQGQWLTHVLYLELAR